MRFEIRTLFAMLFIGLMLDSLPVWAMEFYVSPDGNDSNPGTKAKPFATITRARDVVRQVKKKTREPITVYLREGIYYLKETIVFGLEDSAPDDCEIVYSAYPAEQPILSSGVKISGWKKIKDAPDGLPAKAKGQVWVADVPKELELFRTLYDGDPDARAEPRNRGLPRASKGFSPTTDPVVKGPSYHSEIARAEELRTVAFPEEAIKNWPNLGDVEIVIRPFYPWVMNILTLESVDEQACKAKTTLPGTYPLSRLWGLRKGEISAWVENVLEALDEPGEWVLNTLEGKIYLWPIGDSPGDKIFAPCLTELIRVDGDVDIQGPVDHPVRGIVFKGLTFTHGDRGVWTKDDAGIQHDWEMVDKGDALIRFRGAEQCQLLNCKFTNSGGSAIRLDLHCQKNLIAGNETAHLGGAGILLIGYGPGTKDVNKENTIINNHIRDIGQIYWHSHAIVAWQSGQNRIANNYIHHCPRKAICLSGVRPHFFDPKFKNRRECAKSIRWNEVGSARTWDQVLPFLHSRNNLVEHNEVHHALQMLGDGAAINVSGAGTGNIIRRNYVHDINNLKISGCIRTDDYQKGTLIEENIIFRSGPGGITPKGENFIINNFIIDVGAEKGDSIHISGGWGPFGKTKIVRNIFFSPKEAKNFYYRFRVEDLDELAGCEIDRNVYFNGTVTSAADNEFLKELRKQGHDENSFYGDPLFEDWQRADFRLKPNSPALKLGIKPIDLSNVGLKNDS